jgi:hypothetical protein
VIDAARAIWWSPTEAGLSDAIGRQKARAYFLADFETIRDDFASLTIVCLPDGGSANIAMSLEGVVVRLSGSRGLGEDAT